MVKKLDYNLSLEAIRSIHKGLSPRELVGLLQTHGFSEVSQNSNNGNAVTIYGHKGTDKTVRVNSNTKKDLDSRTVADARAAVGDAIYYNNFGERYEGLTR